MNQKNIKFNPFRPNSLVGPGMFTGRIDELDTIEKSLFQAKNGNPPHFLIEGERGIGKSSLLYLAQFLAEGEFKLIYTGKTNFLTVFVDMGGVETQLDIVRVIARNLRDAISERETLKETVKTIWDFLSKWEIMGTRYHKDQTTDPEDARDELVKTIANLIKNSNAEIDGLFIIIDEADNPGEEARLGEFLKLFTERLTKRECNNVLLGIAGLPTTIPKLRASHESSPRIFEILRLDPLTIEESKHVVIKGLNEAEEKNGFKTEVTADALNAISELSEGYPHFIQQFAYFAFAEDEDNIIDVHDVMDGAYKENGALMQLGSKYFSEMYHVRISSEDYRQVLNTMSHYGDKWVARKDIIAESGVSESSVTNALSALKARNIIVSDESRRGYYRLPTKSFAAWINAIRSVESNKEAGSPDLFSS